MMDPQPLPLPSPAIPAAVESLSRPSSTSSDQASAPALPSLPQLPSISALAGAGSATGSPQLRATNLSATYSGASPASTVAPGGNSVPTCQNCATSTTPLWRRDEMGSVLCNACGLFLKLHGRPRPISLKTDVIKSRNRVKTMRPDLAKKKQQQQQQQQQQGHLATPGHMNGADPSGASNGMHQKMANDHMNDTNSPISRTDTPNMYGTHPALPMYHVEDPHFQTQSLTGFGTSPGRAPSPLNGELPPTHENLMAVNASLKTRVSELEVIQELYRSRLAELEQNEAATRQSQELSGKTELALRAQLDAVTEAEGQVRKELEESHRRENALKRRLDELELELKDVQDALAAATRDGERAAKKPRLDDGPNARASTDATKEDSAAVEMKAES